MNISYLLKSRKFFRIFFFILIFIWCFGFISPVLFGSIRVLSLTYPFTKKIYSLVCHQIPAKTFFINGDSFLVCARCTGIYSGALIFSAMSLLGLSFNIKSSNILLISLLPLSLDVLMTTAGAYSYSKFIAMITGLFFGSVSFIYILSAVEKNLFDEENGQ